MTVSLERINITLPKEFIADLRKVLPSRGISAFFYDSAKEKLARLERLKILEELKTMEDPFPFVEDSVDYVNSLREQDFSRYTTSRKKK